MAAAALAKTRPEKQSASRSILQRVLLHLSKWMLVILAGQVLCLALFLGSPSIQRGSIFLHWLKVPFGRPLEPPSLYGFKSPFEAFPLRLNTSDGIQLGCWHLLSPRFDPTKPGPFFIYFHGNAGTRALSFRTELCQKLFHVYANSELLIIDYRGFGDSTGLPTQQGVLLDAQAAWDYATIVQRVPPQRIVLVGQSIGTTVATLFARRLDQKKLLKDLLQKYTVDHLDSFKAVQSGIACPKLWIHGTLDHIVPLAHSQRLVEAALNQSRSLSPDTLADIDASSVTRELRPGLSTLRLWPRHRVAYLLSEEAHHNNMHTYDDIFEGVRFFLSQFEEI